LKDAAGEGEVVAVSVGTGASSEQLRSALAMGADRAVLLKGEPTLDGLATARALAAEAKEVGADLVLLGMKAVDGDQQQVAPMLAELLDMPCVTVASSVEMDGAAAVAHREVEGGVEVVEVPTPAVISITKGEYEPRYPSLKGIMAAKKKPLEEKDAQLGESRIELRELAPPPERPAGRIVGEGVDAVPELVRALREEAKVL
jgi:electron transfer flavoprotein beta subunit